MKTRLLAALSAVVTIAGLLLIPSAGASTPSGNPAPPPPPGFAAPHTALVANPAVIEGGYVAVAPCRVVDTRTTDTPKLTGTIRTFTIAGKCGIPAAATSVTTNATVINPSAAGFIRAWATGQPESNTILNFLKGLSLTSAPVIPLGTGGAISVHEAGSSSDFAIDVVGYHIAPIDGTFDSSGALISGSGRLTAYSHGSTGYYTLIADRDLTGCVPVVSAYYYAYNASAYAYGIAVYVQIVNSSDGTPANYYFQVTVNC